MLQQQLARADIDLGAPPSQPPLVYLDWRQRLDREIERQFPAEVLETFTPSQYAVFETLRSRAPSKHAFEYRVSIPTPRKAYYLTIFAGPERRSAERLAREGQTSLPRRSQFIGTMLFLMVSSSVFGAMCLIYLVKSAIGVDLFDG
jgi:hypothetical protein